MAEASTILADNKRRVLSQRGKSPRDAVDFIYMSTDDAFDTPFEEIEAIQLATLKARFETQMEKIAPLRQLATQQNIRRIDRLEDAAALLFGPKVFKSYPLSLLEGNHFEKLTQWIVSPPMTCRRWMSAAAIPSMRGWIVSRASRR